MLAHLPRLNKCHLALLVPLILLITAIYLHFISMYFVSGDYAYPLSSWQRQLHEQGIAGIKNVKYDYAPPYIYLLYLGTFLPLPDIATLKLISFAFDLIMAGGVFAIVQEFKKSRYVALVAGTLVLLVPEVLLNSAWWGQIDASYTAGLVWAVYFLMRNKFSLGWVCFSIALSFKLQAIFALPAIIAVAFLQKHGIHVFLFALCSFIGMWLPALILGRDVVALTNTYVDQSNAYPALSLNAPNLYLFTPDNLVAPLGSIALVISAVVSVLLILGIILWGKHKTNNQLVVPVFALSLLIMPFVLPHMHERYFYAAGCMIFILAFFQRRYIFVLLGVQCANVAACLVSLNNRFANEFPYVADVPWVPKVATIPETVALILLACYIFIPKFNGVATSTTSSIRD